MRKSKYWDDFERRAKETSLCISQKAIVPIRRAAIFVTDRCNFRCKYCNHKKQKNTMSQQTFQKILSKYGSTAIIHITGGEPSLCDWLYPFLDKNKDNYRFHLNTNAYIYPPAHAVKRLKISLDGYNEREWDFLVGRKGAFKIVCENIQKATKETNVSITFTLNRTNLENAVDFTKFCNKKFPNLYAIFFSIYKGNDQRFIISREQASFFFKEVKNKLLQNLNKESRALLCETIDEKRRLLEGVRFLQPLNLPCFLSMSERVFSPMGDEYTCSHLYRDNIFMTDTQKVNRCQYGCNQRLVQFNKEVETMLVSNKAFNLTKAEGQVK